MTAPCTWCGLPIQNLIPPRCKTCNVIVCHPNLRDCGYEHWRVQHANQQPRKIEDVRPL